MYIKINIFHFLCALLLSCGCPAYTQDNKPDNSNNDLYKNDTYIGGEMKNHPVGALKRLGISDDCESLIKALSHEKYYIRAMAAKVIADKNYIKAIPYLKKASIRETNIWPKIEIYTALALFKDNAGYSSLDDLCLKNRDQWVYAAYSISDINTVQNRNDESCYAVVINTLSEPNPDRQLLQDSLQLVFRYTTHLSEHHEFDKVKKLILKWKSSKDIFISEKAVHAYFQICENRTSQCPKEELNNAP